MCGFLVKSAFLSGGMEAGIDDLTSKGNGGAGSLVIWAAGNDNLEVSSLNSFPAHKSNVISVIASTPNDKRKIPKDDWDSLAPPDGHWGSNFKGDIAAPGTHLLTTDISGQDGYNDDVAGGFGIHFLYRCEVGNPDLHNNFTFVWGSSGAAAIVAGICALVWEANPWLDAIGVRDIIYRTTDRVGCTTYINGYCNDMGRGRINAWLACLDAEFIKEINESQIDVKVVNPVSDKMYIYYRTIKPEEKFNLRFYDIFGRELFEKELPNTGIFEYDISKYVNGMYLIRIENNSSQFYSSKLIKVE
ncbi:MAG: S8 family serine peptidase [Bacteroidetes bacterium]|nr:S8 family serine peptidase [Bacteroidota bacterium]